MLRRLTRFKFSSNPYYVLGVNEQTPMPEIKKAYYKMAAQFHPDINKTAQATKQFMLIKESFEQIKMMKGEGQQMSMERQKQEFTSVRKNASQYNEDWKDEKQTDYQEFVHKTSDESSPDVNQFRDSFRTMAEMNDGFKPIDMKMPDPSRRFHLDVVMRLKAFGDGSETAIIILGIGIFLFMLFFNYSIKKIEKQQMENYIYSILNYQRIKEDLDDEDFISHIEESLRDREDYKQYVAQQKQQKRTLNGIIPLFQDYVSSKEIQQEHIAL